MTKPIDYEFEMQLALESLNGGNKYHAAYHYRRAAKALELLAHTQENEYNRFKMLNRSYDIMERVRIMEEN